MKSAQIILLLISLTACSQSLETSSDAPGTIKPSFGGSSSEYATGIAEYAGGVYVVGTTYSFVHGSQETKDGYIRKYTSSGNFVWGQLFGTSGSDEVVGVNTDSKNNAYILGTTDENLERSDDFYLRKYSPQGNMVWARRFGTQYVDYAGGVAIYGNYIYVTGYHYVAGKGDDVFLAKFNLSGSLLWRKTFGTVGSNETGDDITVDNNGNLYVVGSTGGSLSSANNDGFDMFILKLNPTGKIIWIRQKHFVNSEYARAVAVNGNDVYLVGEQQDELNLDIRLLRYASSGRLLGSYRYGKADDRESVHDLVANSGGVVFVGDTEGSGDASFAGIRKGGVADGYAVKVKPNGVKLWSTVQGTAEYDSTNAVALRSNSEVYLAGEVSSDLGAGYYGLNDAFLQRLQNSDGSTVWVR